MMDCYLDNSATTACDPRVTELVVKLFESEYGNPSSMHLKGFEGEKHLHLAKETLAKIWKVTPAEIIFTSGGTESDNMAIIGTAMANKRQGMHIITTRIEHAAVKASTDFLQKQGFEITYLGTDKEGVISLEELKAAIRPDTILVSIMHVNNEIGSVQPIEEIGKIIKSINPKCLFHVDDIQGFGKLSLYPKKMNIDMISISGHKIHGPKGSGALYLAKGVKIFPLILGGGQQNGLRSGTENVPGYAGLALAAKIMQDNIIENTKRLYELRKYLCDKLLTIDDVVINGPLQTEGNERIAPHIISLSVKDVRAEVLLHSLEERNVFVSAGSACSSNKPAVSETLKAINVDKNMLDSTVRLSFSVHSTKEEADMAFDVLSQIIPMLRKYKRG